jgi:hypothetical protein
MALLIGISTAYMGSTQGPEWPKLQGGTAADPSDIAAIKAVVERSYDVTGRAARNFDLSEFPTVFANDSAVPLGKDEVAYLTRNSTLSISAAQTVGLLNYKLAFYGNWKDAAESFERLEAQAKAEGRSITAEELNSISSSGQHPVARGSDPMYKTNVKFEKVTVDGTRAEVISDDGAVTYLLALSKTKDGWRIVGERVLDVHV